MKKFKRIISTMLIVGMIVGTNGFFTFAESLEDIYGE